MKMYTFELDRSAVRQLAWAVTFHGYAVRRVIWTIMMVGYFAFWIWVLLLFLMPMRNAIFIAPALGVVVSFGLAYAKTFMSLSAMCRGSNSTITVDLRSGTMRWGSRKKPKQYEQESLKRVVIAGSFVLVFLDAGTYVFYPHNDATQALTEELRRLTPAR